MEEKRKRGFAAMTPERLREVAGRGGRVKAARANAKPPEPRYKVVWSYTGGGTRIRYIGPDLEIAMEECQAGLLHPRVGCAFCLPIHKKTNIRISIHYEKNGENQ